MLAALVLSALGMSKVLEGTLYPMPDLVYRQPIPNDEFEKRMSIILEVVTKYQEGVPITEARRAGLTRAFEPVSTDNPDVGNLKHRFVNALAAAPAVPATQSDKALYYMRYYYRHQALALDGRTVYGHWYDEKWLSEISRRLAAAQNFFLSLSSTVSPASTVSPVSTVRPTTTSGYPAWSATADYHTWPSLKDILAEDTHLVSGLVDVLIYIHELIPLDASHKKEFLQYLGVFELFYGDLVDAATIDALRTVLDMDVELSPDVDYGAFLKAEGEFLRGIPFCLVDLEKCEVSLEDSVLVMDRELFKVISSMNSTVTPTTTSTVSPVSTVTTRAPAYTEWNLDFSKWPISFSNPSVDLWFETFIQYLSQIHAEFQLPESNEQELLSFVAFLQKRYSAHLNKGAVGHLIQLRKNLTAPFKVQEQINYDALLESERYLLQNIHECFEGNCENVWVAVEGIEAQLDRVVQPRVLRGTDSKPLFGMRRRQVAANRGTDSKSLFGMRRPVAANRGTDSKSLFGMRRRQVAANRGTDSKSLFGMRRRQAAAK